MYKVLTIGILLTLAIFGSLGFAKEPSPLVGEWEAVASSRGGVAKKNLNFDGMKWVVGKDSFEVTPALASPAGLSGKGVLKCGYAVDNTKTPAHFNWTIGEGDKKASIDAIYELNGDTLRICFAQRGLPRPAGFEAKDRESIYEFKRVVK